MRFSKLLLALFIVGVSHFSWGQFYEGIPEVKPYLSNLAKLDIYLQTSPDNLHELYDDLYSNARKKKNKTLEAVLNIYKGTGYYYSGQSDSAVVYFNKSIDIASEIKNQKLVSTARIRKIFVIGESTDNKVAFRMMKDEFDAAASNKDTLNMIYSMNGMSLFGEEDSGFDANMRAIQLAQNSGNEYEYGFLLNNLGVTKLDLDDPPGALADFEKAIDIAKRVENPRLELTVMENLAYYYLKIDSIELAKKKLYEVYDRAASIKHNQVAVTAMVNLGSLYHLEGGLKKSDSLTEAGLMLSKETKMYHVVSMIYLNKASLELAGGRYNKVNENLDSVEFYQKYTPNNKVQMGIYEIQYQMSKKRGDFEMALNYYAELKDFQDSINKNGRLQMISELQLKFDVEKKEKERVQQKIGFEKMLANGELKTANLRENIAIGAIVFILLLAGLVIYYFRAKHNREREFSSALVNKLEEERGRIARDLHDGLGQSLVILKNKFNKIESGVEGLSEELNDNFADTIEEVRSISRSLIPPELRRLGLKKSLNKMLKDVEFSAGIVVSIEIDDLDSIKLEQPSEIRIYRIIQELTNNTIKHSEATSLKLEVTDMGNWFSIVYRDNGKGLAADKMNASVDSVGLRSIQQRMSFLNGTVRFERPQKGFKATIKIKNQK
ncbi:MAG: tetratricopeptide (TPR) repeat protein [Crocinitomicaceae bacterium]|jgi:tetratricopeptide (TPR) repeat protein